MPSLGISIPGQRSIDNPRETACLLGVGCHHSGKGEGKAELTFRVSVRQRLQSGEVLRAVASLDGVTEARWY